MNKIINKKCPCKKKKCERYGDCFACREHHNNSKRKRQVYCEKHMDKPINN